MSKLGTDQFKSYREVTHFLIVGRSSQGHQGRINRHVPNKTVEIGGDPSGDQALQEVLQIAARSHHCNYLGYFLETFRIGQGFFTQRTSHLWNCYLEESGRWHNHESGVEARSHQLRERYIGVKV